MAWLAVNPDEEFKIFENHPSKYPNGYWYDSNGGKCDGITVKNPSNLATWCYDLNNRDVPVEI